MLEDGVQDELDLIGTAKGAAAGDPEPEAAPSAAATSPVADPAKDSGWLRVWQPTNEEVVWLWPRIDDLIVDEEAS